MFKRNYCIDCGKLLGIKSFWKKNQRCHSCDTKRKHRLGILNIRGENSGRFIDGRSSEKYYCIICKVNKICYTNWLRGQQRCSSCAKKELFKDPKKHPNWNNGSSFEPYSPEFNDSLKDSIRKRDNYICQNSECNMTEEEHLIVMGKVLTIHHIDYNKKNCKETNLITVCDSCNIRANFNRDYWKNYYINKISKGVK